MMTLIELANDGIDDEEQLTAIFHATSAQHQERIRGYSPCNGNNGGSELNGDHAARVETIRVKQSLAQILKGGVIVS